MIAIIDYGAGNLTSVKKAFDHLHEDAVIARDPGEVMPADKIVLPGVGHFSATAAMEANGLRDAIQRKIARGAPFLGICVGMQWMFEASEESDDVKGLGLFTGTCRHFPTTVKSPHVGWNSIVPSRQSRLLQGVSDHAYIYFTHSYAAPVVPQTVARCEYGSEFSAAVERDNLFGVQFHPEKSGATGLKILENFCALPC